jgi:biotin synthase
MQEYNWNDLSRQDLIDLLKNEDEECLNELTKQAYAVKTGFVGKTVYFRGIIEFSNICKKNCLYCGIRRENTAVNRFTLSDEEILESAKWAYDNNYGSLVLQSGEREDPEFVSHVTALIKEIRNIGEKKLGITLSLGEQTKETYQKWFDAGAHRYLLRIETSDRELYEKLHPEDHSFSRRFQCIRDLKEIGYQTGTGVMIGIPGQTEEQLASDIIFFRENDIDMIGMGPYVVHSGTPLAQIADNSEQAKNKRFNLALKMIALTRIFLKDINIAATTAMQSLNPIGREMALLAGANIIMPIITPASHRKDYLLYDGKPCIDDLPGSCKNCLESRIKSIGETIGYGKWGDSPHFTGNNRKLPDPGNKI